MIDTLSLLIAHFLLAFVTYKVLMHPYLNEEPAQWGRLFKPVLPKKRTGRAGVETGQPRPGDE